MHFILNLSTLFAESSPETSQLAVFDLSRRLEVAAVSSSSSNRADGSGGTESTKKR
jgi:hypothetical protein